LDDSVNVTRTVRLSLGFVIAVRGRRARETNLAIPVPSRKDGLQKELVVIAVPAARGSADRAARRPEDLLKRLALPLGEPRDERPPS